MADEEKESSGCFACDHGMGSLVEWEQKSVDEYGWYAHVVADDHDVTTGYNAHTHFFWENLKHLDVQIVVPLHPQVVIRIFHNVAARIRGGEHFVNGPDEYAGIIANGNVRFALTTETGEGIEIKDGKVFGSRPVLRMILPSPNGQLDAALMDSEIYAKQWDFEPLDLDAFPE